MIIAVRYKTRKPAWTLRFDSGKDMELASWFTRPSAKAAEKRVRLAHKNHKTYPFSLLFDESRDIHRLDPGLLYIRSDKNRTYYDDTDIHANFPFSWPEFQELCKFYEFFIDYNPPKKTFMEREEYPKNLLPENFPGYDSIMKELKASIEEHGCGAHDEVKKTAPTGLKKIGFSLYGKITGVELVENIFSLQGYNRESELLEWEVPYGTTMMRRKDLIGNGIVHETALSYGSVSDDLFKGRSSTYVFSDSPTLASLGDFSPEELDFWRSKYLISISIYQR